MTPRCLQCGGTRDPLRPVLGGYQHPACTPVPAGRIARTVEPPPDRDLRRVRAERVGPYRPSMLTEYQARYPRRGART